MRNLLLLLSLAALGGCARSLVKAAAAGDLARVDEMLKQGLDINGRSSSEDFKDCETPLLAAASAGRNAVVEDLAKRGARLDGALYCAASSGNVFTLRLVAAAGAKKDAKTAAALAKLTDIKRAEMSAMIDSALAEATARR
jgi:hypothetical protein